jgi:hypothetical protein
MRVLETGQDAGLCMFDDSSMTVAIAALAASPDLHRSVNHEAPMLIFRASSFETLASQAAQDQGI